MSFEIPLAEAGSHTLAGVITALESRRLTVVRSFTLPGTPADPGHYQYAVLLVYGPGQPAGQPPATLTVHSRAMAAWATLVQDANSAPDPGLVEQILAALTGGAGSTGSRP